MKIGFKLSLTLGSFSDKSLVDLIDRFVRFEPYRFINGTKSEAWNERKHRKVIEKYAGDVFLALNDRAGNVFSVGPTNVKHSYLSLTIAQDAAFFLPSSDDINNFLQMVPGLISAYLYNEDYVFIQSEVFENNFIRKEFSKDIMGSIRNTPFKIGGHGTKEYDVRFNPGRRILLDRSYLLAAWKMWLAPPFFVLVPKERILAFPHAVEIKELPSGVVYVKLFESLEESHTVDSMFRQWKWQEWLDFDELIKSQDSW